MAELSGIRVDSTAPAAAAAAASGLADRRGSLRQPEEEDPADDSGDSLDAKREQRIHPQRRATAGKDALLGAAGGALGALGSIGGSFGAANGAPRAVQSEPRARSASAAPAATTSADLRAKLLVGARSSADLPLPYGTNVTMQRRHSILRMTSGRGMKKSASVEFILSQEEQVKIVEKSIHLSGTSIGSNRDKTPRRLTFEEKEELYRVRPDLEIGPAPFFNEKMQEMNTRNQRRIIFAMFGGMLSIVMLLIIYSVLAGAGQM